MDITLSFYTQDIRILGIRTTPTGLGLATPLAAIKLQTNSMSANLPRTFDDGDFDAWLREFEDCWAANRWKDTESTDHKILKPLAFLRGRAASNFYAIPEPERRTCKNAINMYTSRYLH